MNIRLLITTSILLILPLLTPGAAALTVEQFSAICRSAPNDCSEHPVVQAYIGGALDLVATLDEETNYLHKIYCKKPEVLFDVSTIIHFIQQHAEKYATRNAMILLVRYFEQHGGCAP